MVLRKEVKQRRKEKASKRLEEMRSGITKDNCSEEKLLELANWMLCPRWHLDKIPQGPEIARKWFEELQEASNKVKSGRVRMRQNAGKDPYQPGPFSEELR